MLRWCSYCQQFLGEVPDYEKLTITHGVCATCEPLALEFTGSELKLAQLLMDIQHQLYEAGRRNDLAAAEGIMQAANNANVRSVDVLVGIVAPLLYQVGEDWKRNILSVTEEHRFTSYCNAMFERVAAKMKYAAAGGGTSPGREPQFLLINAPGNSHTLALRFLSLWLQDKGFGVRMIDVPPPIEELLPWIVATRVRTVLISMALDEQLPSVTLIVERVAALPVSTRPRIVVGGYAVKVGQVAAIPGAELLGDISLL